MEIIDTNGSKRPRNLIQQMNHHTKHAGRETTAGIKLRNLTWFCGTTADAWTRE